MIFSRKMKFGFQKLHLLFTFLVYTNGKKKRVCIEVYFKFKSSYIYLVLYFDSTMLFCWTVYAATSMIDRIDQFIAKIMAGIELTAMYTLSLGQNYPPIDQDVTFWCVIP